MQIQHLDGKVFKTREVAQEEAGSYARGWFDKQRG
jgi:hypothetical protein